MEAVNSDKRAELGECHPHRGSIWRLGEARLASLIAASQSGGASCTSSSRQD